jgi:hypothetical protein
MPRPSTTSAVAPDISTRRPAAVSRAQRASGGAELGAPDEETSGTKVSSEPLDCVDEAALVRSRHRHQVSDFFERRCLLAKTSALWPLRSQRSTILRHSVALRRGLGLGFCMRARYASSDLAAIGTRGRGGPVGYAAPRP